MGFDQLPQNKPQEKGLDVKREKYLDLVNDFGVFITMNAMKLDQQILPGKEVELAELRSNLRKPIINGMNYSEFTFQNSTKLTDPTISSALITKIYEFLIYIEPRLVIFQPNSMWVTRFNTIKQKYTELVLQGVNK